MEPKPHEQPDPATLLAWIDTVADRFEAAWNAATEDSNTWPALDAYCDGASDELKLSLLKELVPLDAEYRCKLSSVSVSLRDYVQRFPDLDKLPIPDQTELANWLSKVNVRYVATSAQSAPPATRPYVPPKPGGQMLAIGERVGCYLIVKKLGQGGQAVTYLAQDTELGRTAVLKLSLNSSDSPETDETLSREGQLLASLEHPNLVRVFGLGEWQGHRYLAMEEIKGRTLEQYQQEEHPTPRQAASLIAAVAAGLAAAHQHGIQHLDLTPRNVLVDASGVAKVIDFGLSRNRGAWNEDPTTPGIIRGTPAFMTPEQATAEAESRLGPWTDVFALGALLYYLLCGRGLYQGTIQEVLKKAAAADIDFAALEEARAPGNLVNLCRQALRRAPTKRPSMTVFANRLEAAARPSRWPWLVAAVALFFVCAIGGAKLAQMGLWTVPTTSDLSPSVEVRVERDGQMISTLEDAVPVKNGEAVQFNARVPAGMYAALFLIEIDGKIRLLKQVDPMDRAGSIRYPEDAATLPLSKQAGTSCVLICVRRTKIDASEIEKAWAGGDWPVLPPKRIMAIKVDLIEWEKTRGGNPLREPPPELVVDTRLEEFRKRLLNVTDSFAGLAFSQH